MIFIINHKLKFKLKVLIVVHSYVSVKKYYLSVPTSKIKNLIVIFATSII